MECFCEEIFKYYLYIKLSQLQDVLDNCEIKPINNQIEVNPYIQNDKLVDFCQKNSICVSVIISNSLDNEFEIII